MKNLILVLFLLVLSASVIAQSRVVPIGEMKVGGLLGGVENGKFIDAKTTVQKLSAEQNYTLFMLDGTTESWSMKKPNNSLELCEDFFPLGFDDGVYTQRFEKGGVVFGEGYNWKPLPREVKSIGLKNPTYLKIVNDFLRTKGITHNNTELKQAFRIDLEGDGQEEVILAANRIWAMPEQPRPKKPFDEYSFVLLRKIVGGKPQNFLISGRFFPKSRYEYDDNDYTVSALADLNGDGKMEIVVYGQYYEGNSAHVFQMTGNKAVEVITLNVGCGV